MTTQADHLFNTTHLDYLSEDVPLGGDTCRIVHIYAHAPDYHIVPDPEEGTACVDDVARAAVVLLRHFELTGDPVSRCKAEGYLRFIMYMQTPEGLFYNFVHDRRLRINKAHPRSRADGLYWWACRAVWALATGVRALGKVHPELADACAERVTRTLPHVRALLERYPQTETYLGRIVPTWLVAGDAADATSELLLGLVAFNQARPDVELQTMISQLAEGIGLMRYGSMNTFPYGLHASTRHGWHKWGNAQTQALAEARILTSARLEAEQFYPRLLIEGFVHSISFDDLHAITYFERIAYGIRCVAVGLIRLYEATGDPRYAKMAGLAASWFTGNNVAGQPMYDPATGRGYDGLHENNTVNKNAGAESTIEALYTILETEHCRQARQWLFARGNEPQRFSHDGHEYLQRVFEADFDGTTHRMALLMNLSEQRLDVLEGDALDRWLAETSTAPT